MSSVEAREYQARFFRRNPGLRQPLQLMKAVPNASFFVKDLDCRYVLEEPRSRLATASGMASRVR